jgi:hypothetical protein
MFYVPLEFFAENIRCLRALLTIVAPRERALIDLDLGPTWEFNVGVGLGLTSSTDRLIVTMILGCRFDWSGGGRK